MQAAATDPERQTFGQRGLVNVGKGVQQPAEIAADVRVREVYLGKAGHG